jgi:hypothetical protein
MNSSTLNDMAVAGRRVEYRVHRSLNDDRADVYVPGIITGTEAAVNGSLLARVRLDGQRNSLALPADYDGLRYLDEVVDVPALPMGPFTPVADEMNGFLEREGVLLALLGEDGEDMVLITTDRDKARTAALAYAKETDLDLDYLDFDALDPKRVVFEWAPEESEYPWSVHWDAIESDAHAVHVFFLPV